MIRFCIGLLCGLSIFALLMVGYTTVYVPEKSPTQRHITIEPGNSALTVASKLSSNPIEKWAVYLVLVARGQAKHLKAGEFMLPQGLTFAQHIDAIVLGHYQVTYRLTFIEGTTLAESLEKLRTAPGMVGDITQIPSEGMLYPDTYHYYRYGEVRQKFLDKVTHRMQQAVQRIWNQRARNLPISTPEHLLILASIVEKETSHPQEMPQVAEVFYNRLRKNMRLQADPTVIYGLSPARPLGRELTRADLQSSHAFNTYVHQGLPPTPIAIPSLAALQAAAHPATTGALYFVADGTGGHVFSRDLPAHRHHHNALRALRKRNSKTTHQKP